MSAAPPDVQDRIGGYALLRELGRGAVGVVFEALTPDGRPAAVKIVVPPALLSAEDQEALRARFFREARAMAAVQHPNVARILDVGEDAGHLFLAMELLTGENLRELVLREGALPPATVVAVGTQLCEALDAVHHAGIVHRDVKPENVVLLADGTAKLTDFGVAWMENEATLTRTGGVLGSPAFMAPEQILGRATDRRADLFSAAATLYQMATGALPFTGNSLLEMAHSVAYEEPRPLPPAIPQPLGRAIMKVLQKTPAPRIATATEFAQALRATIPTVRSSPMPQPGPGAAGALTTTIIDPGSRCSRHSGRPSVGQCRACRRPLCRHCAKGEGSAVYCLVHQPVTLFGISTVRFEIAIALAAFLLLLLCLSPVGFFLFRLRH
jgi:serine/threonine-protein kinase